MSYKLDQLKKSIPYKWRVQSFSKYNSTATCVAYIDARDVMNILDDVLGPENWQDDYKEAFGQIIAGIGIKFDSGWVWKWDTGSESEVEKEKGLVSDAFKRAAVKWGIGRFLYELSIQTVNTNGPKSESNKYPYVVDENGQKVWNLTEHINSKNNKVHKEENKKQVSNNEVADNIPDGTHTVTVLEVFNGKSKATGKPFQKVKTGDGVAWNNCKNGTDMVTGNTYTVTVKNGSIFQADEVDGFDDISAYAPSPEEYQQ